MTTSEQNCEDILDAFAAYAPTRHPAFYRGIVHDCQEFVANPLARAAYAQSFDNENADAVDRYQIPAPLGGIPPQKKAIKAELSAVLAPLDAQARGHVLRMLKVSVMNAVKFDEIDSKYPETWKTLSSGIKSPGR